MIISKYFIIIKHGRQCTKVYVKVTMAGVLAWAQIKEIVERRHGEAMKFLFLRKMGLLGSQAGNEKNAGCEL